MSGYPQIFGATGNDFGLKPGRLSFSESQRGRARNLQNIFSFAPA